MIITDGKYDDYGVHGVYHAVQDFAPDIELSNYLHYETVECSVEWGYKKYLFIDYLIHKNLIYKQPHTEVFLGGYSAPGEWTLEIREPD